MTWIKDLPDWQVPQRDPFRREQPTPSPSPEPIAPEVSASEVQAESPSAETEELEELEELSRVALMRLAVSMGLRASGTDEELRQRIRSHREGTHE